MADPSLGMRWEGFAQSIRCTPRGASDSIEVEKCLADATAVPRSEFAGLRPSKESNRWGTEEMTSKLNYYDVVGVFLPGVLVLGVLIVTQKGTFAELIKDVPSAIVTLVFSGLAIVTGQVVHLIGSLIEPLLFASWLGRPSDQLLAKPRKHGTVYLSEASSDRIRTKLEAKLKPDTPSSFDLFLYAQTLAGGEKGRVGIFNSLYAHHRSLLVACLASLLILQACQSACELRGLLSAAACATTILFWWRGRARAFYFAREVLLAAEKEIDS